MGTPGDVFTSSKLAVELAAFRDHALHHAEHLEFTLEHLNKALDKYKNNTLGSDLWAPDELRRIPDEVKVGIANAIQVSLRTVAIPHQKKQAQASKQASTSKQAQASKQAEASKQAQASKHKQASKHYITLYCTVLHQTLKNSCFQRPMF